MAHRRDRYAIAVFASIRQPGASAPAELGSRAIATKHRVLNPPGDQIAGGARTSIAFFYLPNWNCPLRPVFPDSIDHTLGEARENFGLDALRDPDGSIPYYRLLQRESELGFTK